MVTSTPLRRPLPNDLDVAMGTTLDADTLGRLLWAMVTLDVCRVQGNGRFLLGPYGELMRRNHAKGLRHGALLNG